MIGKWIWEHTGHGFDPTQCGAIKNSLTTHVHIDIGESVQVFFIDLSKAFDLVNHPKVIEKLSTNPSSVDEQLPHRVQTASQGWRAPLRIECHQQRHASGHTEWSTHLYSFPTPTNQSAGVISTSMTSYSRNYIWN